MKRIILVVFSLMVPLWGVAEQTHSEDYLVIGDEGHFIRADPLNIYLTTHCPNERLRKYVDNFCTPYWPNYTRYWELKGKYLYLVKIENGDKEPYPLKKLFPAYDGSPVEAKWFSGNVSYRKGDSPIIQLNREFYEEETAIRFLKGRVVERFTIDHRERWISYARRIMDRYLPLAGFSPDIPEAASNKSRDKIEFLNRAFWVVTQPAEKTSVYCPVIAVEFNVDLSDLRLTEAHGELSCYELLERIAVQTKSVLEVSVSHRLVTYRVRDPEMDESRPPASPAAEGDPDEGAPAE